MVKYLLVSIFLSSYWLLFFRYDTFPDFTFLTIFFFSYILNNPTLLRLGFASNANQSEMFHSCLDIQGNLYLYTLMMRLIF